MKNYSLNKSITMLVLGCFSAFVISTTFTHFQIANSTKNITNFNKHEMSLNKRIFNLAVIQKGISFELDKLVMLKEQFQNGDIKEESFYRESKDIKNFVRSEITRSYRLYDEMKNISKSYEGRRGEIVSLSIELYITDFESFERSFEALDTFMSETLVNNREINFERYEELISLNNKNLNFVLNSYQNEFDMILQSAENYILEGHKKIFYSEIISFLLFTVIITILLMRVKSELIHPLYDMKRFVRSITNKKTTRFTTDSLNGEMLELANSLVAMKNRINMYEDKLIKQRKKAIKTKKEQEKLIKDLNHFLKGHIGIVDTVIHDISNSEHLDAKEANLMHLAESETSSLKEVLDKIEHLYPDDHDSNSFSEKEKIEIRETVKSILGDKLTSDEFVTKNVNLSFDESINKQVYVNKEAFESIIELTLDVMNTKGHSEFYNLFFEKIENDAKDYLYITMADAGEIMNSDFETKINDSFADYNNHELGLLKKEIEILQGTTFYEDFHGKTHLSILLPMSFIKEREIYSNDFDSKDLSA